LTRLKDGAADARDAFPPDRTETTGFDEDGVVDSANPAIPGYFGEAFFFDEIDWS
jgi:hypothetical protein